MILSKFSSLFSCPGTTTSSCEKPGTWRLCGNRACFCKASGTVRNTFFLDKTAALCGNQDLTCMSPRKTLNIFNVFSTLLVFPDRYAVPTYQNSNQAITWLLIFQASLYSKYQDTGRHSCDKVRHRQTQLRRASPRCHKFSSSQVHRLLADDGVFYLQVLRGCARTS